jgi:GTP 3',8-cyclase
MRQPGPLSLRVSVTDRCRFGCLYCTPAEGVERFAPADILRYEEIVRLVRLVKSHRGLAKVHLTGGEPLDRRQVVRLVAMLAAEGIADLAMTTNAQRLNELAGDLRRAGLARLNISLNSLRPDVFRRISSGGELARTIEGLDAARRAGFTTIKFNMTVIRGLNDGEVADIAQFGLDHGAEVRFIELMPLGPATVNHEACLVPAAEILDNLRRRFDLLELPRRPASSSRPYRATDAAGRTGVVGVIASCTAPFCADCNRLRLTANGDLVGCLAGNSRVGILDLLRTDGPLDEMQILEKIATVMARKRVHGGFSSEACMVQVGG